MTDTSRSFANRLETARSAVARPVRTSYLPFALSHMLRLRPKCLTIDRDDFIRALSAADIGTSVHCIPLHLHAYYRKTLRRALRDFPSALSAYERDVSLPISPGVTDDDVEDAVAAVEEVVTGYIR